MRHCLIVALVCLLPACGGSSPTQPTPTPAPQPASYQGVWAGAWVRTTCAESGTAVGVACRSFPDGGGLRLTVAQSVSTISGTVEIGTLPVPVTGLVGSDGSLTLTGSGVVSNVTITVTSWTTRQSGGAMTGAFRFTVVPDPSGALTMDAGLSGVVKTSVVVNFRFLRVGGP